IFYGFLLEKGREVGIDIEDYPALQNYIVYVSIYEAVDRTMVMAELDALEKEIKKGLYRNSDERDLNKLSRNLAILKNIFAIRLTKNDYTYYLDNRSFFDAGEYLSFIESKGPRYRVSEIPDKNVVRLDAYRKKIEKFYEYSFKRDDVFLRNLRFRKMRGDVRGAFLMTGGFHTENLCDLFRKEGISYVSILPKFTTSKEYESPYFDLLAGQVTDVQSMLRSALARSAMLQVASRLCGVLGEAVYGQVDQDIWKARVSFFADQIASGAYLVIKDGKTGEEVEAIGNTAGRRYELTVADLLRQLELSPVTEGTARTDQEPSEGPGEGGYAIRAGESLKAAFMMGALPVLAVAGGIVSGFALTGIVTAAYLSFSPVVQAIISVRAKQTSGWYEAAATEDMLYSEIRNRFGALLTPFVFSHEARHRAGRGEALAYLETMGSPLLAPVLSTYMVLESVLLSALGRTPWARGVIASRDAAVIRHRFNGLLELEPGEVDQSRVKRIIQNPDWDRFLGPSEIDGSGNVINPLDGETSFEITGILGSGGMGEVFSARARGGALDGREIAVKGLKPSSDPQGQLYFLREALLLGFISDIDGVVSLRDAGYYMKDGQRQYYIAMDKAEGVPLGSLIQEGRLDIEDVEAISEQLLRIIRDQHARNILNKDVKPENLIYDTETKKLTMIDLGIASYAPKGSFGANAGIIGTPSFMAPEFFDRTSEDAYVYSKLYDMFAVATTLYQVYTGTMPHRVGPRSVAAELDSHDFVEFVKQRVEPLNDEIERLLSYPEDSFEYFLGMLLKREGFGKSAETALQRFRSDAGSEAFFAGAERADVEIRQIVAADVVPEVDAGEEIIEPEVVGAATRTMQTPVLTRTVRPDIGIGEGDLGYAHLADSVMDPLIVGPDGQVM
ncbi:MAG: protein kinase, partial [Candidatus Omnitrophica bacterium]|nr:protein kinase [Candidatus Omnitrophota bacterium]